MKSSVQWIIAVLMLLPGQYVQSDTIITKDKSTLVGTVKTITADLVIMETTYAGTININTGEIASLETTTPLSVKFADGTLLTGTARIGEDGYVEVENNNMDIRMARTNLLAAWTPGETAPLAAKIDESHWIYSLAGDITGKEGNTQQFGTSIRADAALTSFDDELKFYTSVDRAKANDVKTADEMKLGSSYVAYMSDPWGWYVQSELERDEFESIDLRATVSGGLSYRAFNTPDHSLELRTGIGYRHESFEDGTNDNSPTVNFGLDHFWLFTPWLEMTNILSVAPAIDDFNDFMLVHDSGINMPIGNTNWRLRFGLENDYQNEPATGRKKLDTTYYTRVLLNFN